MPQIRRRSLTCGILLITLFVLLGILTILGYVLAPVAAQTCAVETWPPLMFGATTHRIGVCYWLGQYDVLDQLSDQPGYEPVSRSGGVSIAQAAICTPPDASPMLLAVWQQGAYVRWGRYLPELGQWSIEYNYGYLPHITSPTTLLSLNGCTVKYLMADGPWTQELPDGLAYRRVLLDKVTYLPLLQK